MKRRLITCLFLLLTLAGCRYEYEVCYNGECVRGGSHRIYRHSVDNIGGFYQTLAVEEGSTFLSNNLQAQSINADYSLVSFDLRGSTINLGSGSDLIIKAMSGTTQVDSQSFDLIGTDKVLRFSDPSAVHQFMANLSGSVTKIELEGHVVMPYSPTGMQTLSVDTYYDNSLVSRATSSVYIEDPFNGDRCLDEYGRVIICSPGL